MEVLLLENLAPDALEWLRGHHEVDYRPELLRDEQQLFVTLRDVTALVAPPRLRINQTLLGYAPRLKVIGRIHDSIENIDIEACGRRRVRVTQAVSATVRAQSEFLLSNLLTLARYAGIPSPTSRVMGREINDMRIGLIGMSPVVHELVPVLLALGARLMGYDPSMHRSAEMWQRLGVQPMGLRELLQEAEIVSVQQLYATRYKGMLGEHVLDACRKGQRWAFISRAELFDAEAMGEALRDGRIASLMLDSDKEELWALGGPLADLPNLHLTPRLAAYTKEAVLRGSWFLVDRIHETLNAGFADSRITMFEEDV